MSQTFETTMEKMERADRFDAAYFHPKYDALMDRICSSGSWDFLGNMVSMEKGLDSTKAEYVEDGVPYIRVGDFDGFGPRTDGCKFISADAFMKLHDHGLRKGEILLTKDGNPGIAHCLIRDLCPMIVSGGFLRLRVLDGCILPECLAAVINSKAVRMQKERDVSGSVILHWRIEQIQNAKIPIPAPKIQKRIAEHYRKAIAARESSLTHMENAVGISGSWETEIGGIQSRKSLQER